MVDWTEIARDFGVGGAGAALAALGQYYLALRQDRRAEGQSLSQRAASLFDLLQKEMARSGEELGDFRTEVDRLRDARWALEDVAAAIRDHAVAARAMVHGYERQLGLPETVFPPLPRPGLSMPARGPPAAP